MRTLEHIGIPTTTPKEGENYAEGMKLFLTDPSKSPNKIEWLRFEADSWMHEKIQTETHLAYRIDASDVEVEMAGKEVLLPKTDLGGGNFIAFVMEDLPVELMWTE